MLRGYKGLTINEKSYATNVLTSRMFNTRRNLEDINSPLTARAGDFRRRPSTLLILRSTTKSRFPPEFSSRRFSISRPTTRSITAAIGGVIGHEITHGFDDSGSRFDAEGNLKMWWTAEDRAKFEERAACVVKQFNEYEVQPGLFIDGKLTLGRKHRRFCRFDGRLRRVYEIARRQAATGGHRRFHGGTAFFPRLGAGLGGQIHHRSRTPAGQNQHAFAPALARQRTALEHAAVRQSLRLQIRRQNDSHRYVQDLVGTVCEITIKKASLISSEAFLFCLTKVAVRALTSIELFDGALFSRAILIYSIMLLNENCRCTIQPASECPTLKLEK